VEIREVCLSDNQADGFRGIPEYVLNRRVAVGKLNAHPDRAVPLGIEVDKESPILR
jgi:hypothetical protein